MSRIQSGPLKIKAHQNRSVARREARDTYKYQLKVGSKVIYSGITNGFERREKQHHLTSPGSHVVKVGRKTTMSAALKWEKSTESPSGWDVRKATKQAILKNRDALKELGRL